MRLLYNRIVTGQRQYPSPDRINEAIENRKRKTYTHTYTHSGALFFRTNEKQNNDQLK